MSSKTNKQLFMTHNSQTKWHHDASPSLEPSSPCSYGLLPWKKSFPLWKIDKPPRKWDFSAALTGRLLPTLKERNWCSYFQVEGREAVFFSLAQNFCVKNQSQQRREGTALIHYSRGVCPEPPVNQSCPITPRHTAQLLSSGLCSFLPLLGI